METPNEKLGEIAKDLETITAEADTYTIQSQNDIAIATEFLVKVKARVKRIEELRKFFVKPLNDQVDAINDRFKSAIKPLEEVETKVKRLISDYVLKQEQLRKEEEEQLQELHAKEMAKKEKAAEKAGTEFVPTEAPKIEKALPSVKTESGKTTTIKVWKFEVKDAAAVPREYLVVDETLIRKAVQAGAREIPGVRIYEDVQVKVM